MSEHNNAVIDGLLEPDAFVRRHIGPDDASIKAMCEAVDTDTLDTLIAETMPDQILQRSELDVPDPVNEHQMLEELKHIAQQNSIQHSMIGLGYHPTVTPPVIQRNVLENPGWYTAYTPYQAEIAQGRLEGMLNFQQMVMDLTGMPLSNASLLDEGTAAAEAMAMLKRVNKKNKSNVFLVDANCFPQTIDVIETRGAHLGLDVQVTHDLLNALETQACFGVFVQYPGNNGQIEDLSTIIDKAHSIDALVSVATDLMALVMLKPPGEFGADAVVGSAQRFGVPMGFGGPHAAFLATREEYRRNVPGRIIGVSKDRHGNNAFRMALQTREQHIRREKAMSNICTAQALLAVMASFYGVYHGPNGLKTIACRIHRLTQVLATGLAQAGFRLENETFFDTLTVLVEEPKRAALIQAACDAGINLRTDRSEAIGISVNECTTPDHINALLSIFADDPASTTHLDAALSPDALGFGQSLKRESAFMTHEVFENFHSETEMLRYLKRLENKDLSLAHAMIPLGSCTMKLNATAEMLPVSWPEFAEVHPFCPHEQARGYHALIAQLENWLCQITGFDAISLQPNAGSQGEYAGLLAIKGWHHARGEHHRNICLIPSSAHGTNPASAQMTGMDIVVIRCDEQGNVDLDHLDQMIEQHRDNLAALMVTYPSTHGVFEESIITICEKVRQAGGQVYLDGANTNAVVGWSQVADYADVCHLNLHKTFCIPHGGGGPGVGPIGVRAHLAPHLPGHFTGALGTKAQTEGAVAAAPWGSAGILPISWAYIRLMGPKGLSRATQVAILNANYIATQLKGHYTILYTGRNDRIAHECIVDLRPFKDYAGISEEDVAKRLIDYGFHAPTMSWPVSGTLMIEPTESESKQELDRFIEAMIAIKKEIDWVAQGQWPADDNPLVNAPHTIDELAADDWPHVYSRQQAGWPVEALKADKFFPTVARVDNVHGDRNLVCTCPPLDAYAKAS